ncbi:gamma-glutamyl-gamma-aminobutyrate hydrolase family protein [Shewanella sp. C32]|uniref:Gamma-glutamyl-gamma-aminobutyrate hydrolase family protein n=1 Tax=Shewanella electrica TaxID=515560 RepID=A0ABT2FIF2_9GAMM|nr:gamma-glutamyl-gamma-aminobutyrate hydrolase family protein [Shewanella electrica]MCH1924210.1 gamma-glutamyl-gamma-aminobutyrate hydrolase family protein [Shewanella electrica]MCS4556113.1 gamma-glutamyl-gamma-aminobutyrate hydrolase family protein [Shewanella electrica]
MKLTIIEVGAAPQALRSRFGSLPDMFKRMLSSHNPAMDYEVVSLINGQPVPKLEHIQALFITGSSYSAYDDIPWRPALEELIRAAYAQCTPMVGVCFGHQIIAQALGGTVEKVDRGWGLGRHIYQVAPNNSLIDAPEVAIACSHQDQVVAAPAEADVLLSSAFTPYAGLIYHNGNTLTLQPHPEFEVEYAYALCEMRQGIATDQVVQESKASLEQPLDGELVGRVITRFLTERV